MRTLSQYRPTGLFRGWDNFEDIFNDFERAMTPAQLSQQRQDFTPALDVEEKEGVYLITVDLPGIKKDDIQINLSDRNLTISGERVKEKRGQGHYFERNYGRFVRSLTLPENVKAESIEAHYEDGVLKLLITKAETEKAKSIKVQSGKTGGLLEKFFGSKQEPETKDVKNAGESPQQH
jgi:HSP20 family protein